MYSGLILLFLSFAVLAEPEIAVIREEPANFQEIGKVRANSHNTRARRRDAKYDYVIEELQRQAADMGANAVWLIDVEERLEKEMKSSGGGRFGSVKYREVSHFQAHGIAIIVEEGDLPPADDDV